MSPEVFKADIDLVITTDGKFVVIGRATLADAVTADIRFFADLSTVDQVNPTAPLTLVFLATLPAPDPQRPEVTPLGQVGGVAKFQFEDAAGNLVNPLFAPDRVKAFRLDVTGRGDHGLDLDLFVAGRLDVSPAALGQNFTLLTLDGLGLVAIRDIGGTVNGVAVLPGWTWPSLPGLPGVITATGSAELLVNTIGTQFSCVIPDRLQTGCGRSRPSGRGWPPAPSPCRRCRPWTADWSSPCRPPRRRSSTARPPSRGRASSSSSATRPSPARPTPPPTA